MVSPSARTEILHRTAPGAAGRQQGMTLIELAVVLLVLIGLAGVLLPYVSDTGREAACTATDATLATVRDAIMGGTRSGFYDDMLPHRLPDNNGDGVYKLHYLFVQGNNPDYDPSAARGWHGPYLLNGVTLTGGDVGVLDGFHQPKPILIQIPTDEGDGNDCQDLPGGSADPTLCARLVSEGPNRIRDTNPDDARAASRGDDRVVFLRTTDPGRNQPCSERL